MLTGPDTLALCSLGEHQPADPVQHDQANTVCVRAATRQPVRASRNGGQPHEQRGATAPAQTTY